MVNINIEKTMEKRTKIISFTMVVLMGFLLVSQLQQFANASSNSPYESGRDHGCNDAGISDADDRYINQDEKGPSFHTNEFMRGYNNGYDECSARDNRDSDNDDGGSSGNREVTPAEDVPGCDIHPYVMAGCKIGEFIERNVE